MELARELAGRGHGVHVFSRTQPLGAPPPPGVTCHVLENGHPLPHALDIHWSAQDVEALALRIVDVATATPLHVLHFHYAVPFAGVVAEVRRRLDGRSPRVIGTLHGTDVSVFGRDPRTRPGLARSLAAVDALTTVSRSYAALTARTLGLHPLVIPNFVDLTRFRPDGTATVSNGRVPRIVHVSNFRPVKNTEAVARVFARVRRHVPAELWLVGDGAAMRRVRGELRRRGVERDVRFLGLRREVERILPRMDVLLLTSRSESFGLVALEAAACGVPAVAGWVGGLPEVIRHGHTGLLFPAGDEEAAARGVLGLLTDGGRRRAMGRAAAQRAALFRADLVVPRYETLYRRLVGTEEPDSIRDPAGAVG